MKDLVKQLGPMAFASRLKRLSDRLKADVTKLYQERGIDFNASWFLVGYILESHEILCVSDIAEALGISRPAVSQVTRAMAKHRLISIRRDGKDGRRRHISLTKKGKKTIEELEPIWIAVRDCTKRLLADSSEDILVALADLEDELDKKSMFERVLEQLSQEK